MADDVDAVIAALKAVQRDAEWRTDLTWMKAEKVNRWIRQLPRTRRNNWKNLLLHGDGGGDVRRLDLIGHVHATLSYLEANKATIQEQIEEGPSVWWPFLWLRNKSPTKKPDAEIVEQKRVVVVEKQIVDASDDEEPRRYLN